MKFDAPVIDPVRGQFAAATDEIQHGIGLGAVVTRRGVNVELAFTLGHLGMVNVTRHCAVRDVAGVVVGRAVAVHDELTVGRHGGERRAGVVRVGHLHPVHIEMVGIHVRPQRADRQRPNAIVTLRERHGLIGSAQRGENGHADEPHFLRRRRFQPKRDRPVVMHLGRVERRAEGDELLRVLLRVEVEVDVGLLRTRAKRRQQHKDSEEERIFMCSLI